MFIRHIILILVVVFSVSEALAQSRFLPRSRAEAVASYASVVQKVVPSVVNVYAQRLVKQRRVGLFDDPFFRQFFGDAFGDTQPRQRKQESLGSGVIIDGTGLIVTNHHVIDGGEDLTIILSDRREFKADIVLADERTDLAVLKMRAAPADLPALDLRNSDDIQVGDLVLAVGNPFGVGQTVTSGIVSALARTQVGVTDYQSFIQTDAAINPGNSGGALVTLDGKLLGVNTAIFTRSGGSVGIGFAIPSNMVAQVLRAAKTGGKIVRPWVGADLQNVSTNLAVAIGLDRPSGAVVSALHMQSPLKAAGVRRGDVIRTVDGNAIHQAADMRYRFGTRDIGGRVSLTFTRPGAGAVRTRTRTVQVALVAPPETPPRNETQLAGRNPLAGAVVANINPALADELRLPNGLEGVIILSVAQRSRARSAGFRIGDSVRGVNSAPTKNVAELVDALNQKRDTWTIELLRNGRAIRAVLR